MNKKVSWHCGTLIAMLKWGPSCEGEKSEPLEGSNSTNLRETHKRIEDSLEK